jgi:hypothetical protein
MIEQYIIKNDNKGYLSTDENSFSTFYENEINDSIMIFESEKEAEEYIMEDGDYIYKLTEKNILNIEMAEDFTCKCGNNANDSGFYPCNREGIEVEPVNTWEGHYKCAACDQIYSPIWID